jgi:HlyD family secretion protein
MTEAPPSTAPPPTLDRAATESNIATAQRRPQLNPPAAITGALFLAIIGLAIWYLARPEPLLVQGEVQSIRIDIAARVSDRLEKIAVARGQNVEAGATLLVINNPELVAELRQAEAKNWSPTPNWSASKSERAPRSSPGAKPKSTAPLRT